MVGAWKKRFSRGELLENMGILAVALTCSVASAIARGVQLEDDDGDLAGVVGVITDPAILRLHKQFEESQYKHVQQVAAGEWHMMPHRCLSLHNYAEIDCKGLWSAASTVIDKLSAESDPVHTLLVVGIGRAKSQVVVGTRAGTRYEMDVFVAHSRNCKSQDRHRHSPFALLYGGAGCSVNRRTVQTFAAVVLATPWAQPASRVTHINLKSAHPDLHNGTCQMTNQEGQSIYNEKGLFCRLAFCVVLRADAGVGSGIDNHQH